MVFSLSEQHESAAGDTTNGNKKHRGLFLICECWICLRHAAPPKILIAKSVLRVLLF